VTHARWVQYEKIGWGQSGKSSNRYTFKRSDPKGVLLGFAAFDETLIRKGLLQLAAALE
jgi:hypothetical protein